MKLGFRNSRLARLLRLGRRDPLWDHFTGSPPADPRNDVTPTILGAPEGSIYPVKTEIADPVTVSRNLKELARWLGADSVAIVGFESLPDRSTGAPEGPVGIPEGPVGQESGRDDFPFAILCGIAANYDPREAKGLGGLQAVQKGAVVNHYLRAYIREMGYRASFMGSDPASLAQAAGLGKLDGKGRFVSREKGPYLHLAGVIATDLPLTADTLSR